MADPGVESLNAAGGDVGVEAVVDPRDAVVGPCGFSGNWVVEVCVDKAAAPYAVIAGESGESAERALLATLQARRARRVEEGGETEGRPADRRCDRGAWVRFCTRVWY